MTPAPVLFPGLIVGWYGRWRVAPRRNRLGVDLTGGLLGAMSFSGLVQATHTGAPTDLLVTLLAGTAGALTVTIARLVHAGRHLRMRA